MSARRAKQLIYGVFYGLCWIIFFYGVYAIFLRPVISLPTAPACGEFCVPEGVKPIAPQGSVMSFTTSPGHYTFLAQIANVNSGYAAAGFDYTFTAYDASGTPLQSFAGQSFIYASEIKYLVDPNEIVAKPIDHMGLIITNVRWISGSALGIVPDFTFQNMEIGSSSSTVSVGGEIANKDIVSFAHVYIVGIWKGPDGTPIGASETKIDGLGAGTTADFSVIYPAVPGIDPASNQVFAYGLKGN